MRLSFINQKIKGYFDLIRPFTLLAPIIVSSSIMIASFFYNGRSGDLYNIWWTVIIPASFALAILNGASNTLNQVTDTESDKISKPYRPVPKGLITHREAKLISVILYGLAIAISLTINPMFFVLVLLIVIFSVTYSIPPRFKDLLFVNQIWIGIPRGFLGILASWSVFGNALEPLPLTIGIIAMTFLIGGSITKDILDSEADKKTGTKTLVNKYGVKKAAMMVLPFLFFPFLYIPILIDIGILQSYLWMLTFLCIPAYFIFHLMVKDAKKGCYFENTSSWTLMYVTYFVFAFSFSILTVIGSISA
jgi:geranylgeranylglycerol-phosphate geranylgeranyltransferase